MANSLPQKRLALICQHFYPAMLSTGIFITQLATGLARMGWAVRVYCGQPVYQEGAAQPAVYPQYDSYQGAVAFRHHHS